MDIVDVIGDFVTLKRTGQNYKAKSPFSDEKTPSFIVFPKNQNFKDFSSGKQGDAISFIMEYDGLSYIEAIKYLGQKYGVEIEEEDQSPEQIEKQNERESLFIILNFAKEYFKAQLWQSEQGRNIGLSYFRERGFSDNTIEKFELGYSLDEWNSFENEAKKKKYSLDLLEKAGLIVRKDEKTYDRFRGRVIFPIHNLTGKAIAFGARMLSNAKNQPKYLNSPETEVYHKSKVLYGLLQSSRAIRQQDNCLLVEGYTDVISLHQHGVENVVSSSGTSLTENQILLVKRHTSNITVLFDGDAAGIRASLRGIDMLLRQEMNVKVVVFPDGEDPDSYSQKLGAANFQEFLSVNAEDFIHFKTKILQEGDANDPVSKANTTKQIIESISNIPDPVKRALYIKETGKLLQLDEQLLYTELNKIIIQRRRSQQREMQHRQVPDVLEQIEADPPPKEPTPSIDFQEKEAVRILINYGFNTIENDEINLIQHYTAELKDLNFQNPTCNKILSIFKEQLDGGTVVDKNYFLSYPDQEIRELILDLISTRHEISENWKRYHIYTPAEIDVLPISVYSNILRIKFFNINHLIAANKKKIKEENDSKKLEHLQVIHMKLQNAKMDFAKLLGRVVS
jgi:DNA primase